jgi:hypothetical protein
VSGLGGLLRVACAVERRDLLEAGDGVLALLALEVQRLQRLVQGEMRRRAGVARPANQPTGGLRRRDGARANAGARPSVAGDPRTEVRQ